MRFARTLVAVVLLSAPALLAVEPSPFEQYMLELINRARLDPDGEAARYGIDLNEGPPYQELSSEPRQPLCFHVLANDAALANADDLLTNFEQFPSDHRGSDGSTPADRVAAAGVEAIAVSENTVWRSQLRSKLKPSYVDNLHELLFRDFFRSPEDGVEGRGHRVNLLYDGFNQIGIHVRTAHFADRKVVMAVQNFIVTEKRFLTGVAFVDDAPNDGFYTPGEGVGGVIVRASLLSDAARYELATSRAGGYALELRPGVYRVEAVGLTRDPLVVSPVVVTDRNVKLDFVTRVPPPPRDPEPEFRIEKARARFRPRSQSWRLKLSKERFSHGKWTFDGAVNDIWVLVQGRSYFDIEAGGRAGPPKIRRDRKTGEIERITLRGPGGERLRLDFRRRSLSLFIKRLDTFAIRQGQDLTVEIRLGELHATVVAPVTIAGGARRPVALIEAAIGRVE